VTNQPRCIPLSELIAEWERDPEKAAALAEGRQWVQEKIAREGRDWLYEVLIPVQELLP
jgi:hypothetical protein